MKEEPPKPAPVAPTKPLHTNTNSRKHDSDESSEESSSEEDSDDESAGSDASDDSERRKKKAKKIDVGVSLSSIVRKQPSARLIYGYESTVYLLRRFFMWFFYRKLPFNKIIRPDSKLKNYMMLKSSNVKSRKRL